MRGRRPTGEVSCWIAAAPDRLARTIPVSAQDPDEPGEDIRGDMNRGSSALVEVDLKPGSSRKNIQDILQSPDVSHLGTHHNQCIIRILQHRAAPFSDRVAKTPISLD
jgi:hypothetical protein